MYCFRYPKNINQSRTELKFIYLISIYELTPDKGGCDKVITGHCSLPALFTNEGKLLFHLRGNQALVIPSKLLGTPILRTRGHGNQGKRFW